MIAELPAVPNFVILYRRAFEEFGAAALWSSRPVSNPTAGDALAIRTACAWKAICRRGTWRSRLSRRVVPLSKIQSDILKLLASHRDPESYVA